MKYTFIITFITFSVALTFGQDPFHEYDLEKFAENIFPIQDLDIDYAQLYENMAQILSNPLDLNKATAEQLRSIYLLSEIQITSLLLYREEQGPFISIYELQSIPDFDQRTIELLSPFVTIRSQQKAGPLLERILNEQNNYLLLRTSRTIEQRSGFSNLNGLPSKYVGSPDKIYSRFRIARASDFSLGFTFEKDAGENIRWSPKSRHLGFDYNSFHFQVMNKRIVQNFIAGDYQAQFGQGLILGGGFGMGKGSETITTIRRSNIGFLPYTSINETGFFRGLASSMALTKHFTIHMLAARNWRDGTSVSDSTGSSLSAISSTGLHRTESEISNRKVFLETNYGAVMSYKKKDFELGAIIHRTNFSIPVIRNPAPYNQFSFRGTDNTNASIYLNYNIKNVSLFGEMAYTLNQGKAIVVGALTSLTNSFDLALLLRNYEKDFQTLYGNALSENSTAQNESGYYLGWKYKIDKKHTLAGYSDMFLFPWLRYRGYAPSNGHEWLVRYEYQPDKGVLIYLQAREESKIRNYSGDSNLYGTENGVKRNYWINLDYSLNHQLSFKSRAQFSTYSFDAQFTQGFALVQDVNLKLRKFRFSTRFALFDTDDYDNRQYVFERDVWLAFSFPSYNGVGVRNYAMIQYALSKKIDLWIRWSRIKYVDRESIGSGNEMIQGNKMNDIRVQSRIRF